MRYQEERREEQRRREEEADKLSREYQMVRN
jgi:hypothetical protein